MNWVHPSYSNASGCCLVTSHGSTNLCFKGKHVVSCDLVWFTFVLVPVMLGKLMNNPTWTLPVSISFWNACSRSRISTVNTEADDSGYVMMNGVFFLLKDISSSYHCIQTILGHQLTDGIQPVSTGIQTYLLRWVWCKQSTCVLCKTPCEIDWGEEEWENNGSWMNRVGKT